MNAGAYMVNFAKCRLCRDGGTAAVELAAVMPLLALMLVGISDYGRVFHAAMAVSHAVRAGLQYGAQSNLKATDTAGIQNAATAAATDITGTGGFTVTAYPAGSAGNPYMCWNGITESAMATGTSTCTGTVRVYVKVVASKTFTTLVTYPGLPHTIPIQRTAYMRSQ